MLSSSGPGLSILDITNRKAPELGHDAIHGGLVLLEQHAQLLVLVLQRLVLDDEVRVEAFNLRLKGLCFSTPDTGRRPPPSEVRHRLRGIPD